MGWAGWLPEGALPMSRQPLLLAKAGGGNLLPGLGLVGGVRTPSFEGGRKATLLPGT